MRGYAKPLTLNPRPSQVQCSGTALRACDQAKVMWQRVTTGGSPVSIPPPTNFSVMKMPRFLEKVSDASLERNAPSCPPVELYSASLYACPLPIGVPLSGPSRLGTHALPLVIHGPRLLFANQIGLEGGCALAFSSARATVEKALGGLRGTAALHDVNVRNGEPRLERFERFRAQKSREIPAFCALHRFSPNTDLLKGSPGS